MNRIFAHWCKPQVAHVNLVCPEAMARRLGHANHKVEISVGVVVAVAGRVEPMPVNAAHHPPDSKAALPTPNR